MARLLPETDIRTDEDLIQMLEGIRQVGIAGHDELDELAGMIRMKIERYGRRNGLGRVKARWWGRMVALPLSRCADAMLAVAGYAKVTKNRFEAFVTALDDENADRSDFKVTTRARRQAGR
ncbi:hypothetical protein TPA0907_56060 [Micromonospora humidisoli]|uniref:hypothetical protein n=1 Tax=unclassified Micromonospora TaxID=2617518 RepID=UPI0022C191E2|nr:hypothetical protein [Micromonospora sp. AKA109]GHJ11239.1 hypothetical protein TPA0907_56060 [Micromonospora sp. AKA109]